uniref:triose-phosphate isomerase n=1 Tax=Klebsiella pneumoniae TaxID=573 RepID=UPI0038579320
MVRPPHRRRRASFIRRYVRRFASGLVTRREPVSRLLYGGSVTLQNAVELLRQQEINGLFIGRAAWDAQGYCDIVQRVTQEFILQAQ